MQVRQFSEVCVVFASGRMGCQLDVGAKISQIELCILQNLASTCMTKEPVRLWRNMKRLIIESCAAVVAGARQDTVDPH